MILLVAVTLAACNNNGTGSNGTTEDDGKEPETATFSVTFNTDGGSSLSDFNTKVKYGQTVAEPTKDGRPVIPTKTGYTFNGWTLGNTSTAFVFSTTQITTDTTIKASWVARTYNLTVSLTDGDNVDPSTVSLKNTAGDALTSLPVTFNSKSSLQIPEITDPNDYFVYWYYKEDGKNVPLTVWATKGLTGNITLSKAYAFDKELTIYAMWHSCLPEYTVTYDANGGTLTSATGIDVKENDGVIAPTIPTKDGYEFDYWYFKKTVNEVETEVKFVFDDTAVTTDDFTEVSEDITLYAKWLKKIEVNSAADLEAIRTALNDDNADNDYEYQHANIYIKSNLNLTNWTALFSAEKPFEGKLDGNKLDSNGSNVEPAMIHLDCEVAEYMSFLGVTNGTVKNLDVYVSNIISVHPSPFDVSTVYLSAIAAVNGGEISNSGSTIVCAFNILRNFVVGGIAAKNSGTISDCSTSMTITSVDADHIYAGGIIGVNVGGSVKDSTCTIMSASHVNATVAYLGGIAGNVTGGTFLKNEVTQFTADTVNTDYAYVGGAFGSLFNVKADQTIVRAASANVTAKEAFVGGAIGDNSGILTNCEVTDVQITSSASALNVSGGIIGRNYREGNNRAQLQFALAKSGTVNATATGEGKAYAGAAIGQTQGGSITFIYASVQINMTATDYAIGNMIGKNGAGNYDNLFSDNANVATLNGEAYLYNETEGSGNFKLTKVEDEQGIIVSDDNLRSEAWVKANLSLNPDYDANNPVADKYIWTVTSGTAPTLTFAL